MSTFNEKFEAMQKEMAESRKEFDKRFKATSDKIAKENNEIEKRIKDIQDNWTGLNLESNELTIEPNMRIDKDMEESIARIKKGYDETVKSVNAQELENNNNNSAIACNINFIHNEFVNRVNNQNAEEDMRRAMNINLELIRTMEGM